MAYEDVERSCHCRLVQILALQHVLQHVDLAQYLLPKNESGCELEGPDLLQHLVPLDVIN